MARNRRINIAQEIKDFAAVYSTMSQAMRKEGKQVSPLDVIRGSGAANSPGLGGLRGVQGAASPAPGTSPDGTSTGGAGGFGDAHKALMAALTSRGVKPEVAAGAVGSMMGESGNRLDPATFNPHDVNGPSGGIAQWHDVEGKPGRFTGLLNYAAVPRDAAVQNGKLTIPLQKQVDYLGHELDTSENGTLKKLLQAKTLADGNRIWTHMFERPADPEGDTAKRMPGAQKLWQWAQGQQNTPKNDAGTQPTNTAQALPTQPKQMTSNEFITQQSNPATAVTAGVDAAGNPIDQNSVYEDAQNTAMPQGDADPSEDLAAGEAANAIPMDSDYFPVEGFASGGVVGQRPDRVASPTPGVAIPQHDAGTHPGGARTAMRAVTPGYANGGQALPLRHSYGQRYNPASGKLDSKEAKSTGYYGPLKNSKGDIVSEYSAGDMIGGKEVEYPTLVPGLSKQQVQSVLDASAAKKPVPPDVADIAYNHAVSRINAGKSPFWTEGVDEYPQWSPDQEWESPSPGYADGGAVDEDESSDQQDTAIPLPPSRPAEFSNPVQALTPQEPQTGDQPRSRSSGFLDGLGDALGGALSFLSETFGFGGAQAAPAGQPPMTALPQQQSPTIMEGLRRLFSGEDAASSTEYNTVLNTIDPDKALDNGLRQAAGLNAVYHYYIEHGDAGKAKAVAASLVMHMQGLSQQFGDRAIKYMQQGKTQDAVKELAKGYEMVPDGNSVDATAHPDGSATVTQKDADGNVVQHFRASPQQLLAAALGMKNGTGYYQALADAAGVKQAKQAEPPSEAFKQWQQGDMPATNSSVSALPPAGSPQQVPQQAPQSNDKGILVAPSGPVQNGDRPMNVAPANIPPNPDPGIEAPQGVTPGGNGPQTALPNAGPQQMAMPQMPQLQLPEPPAAPDQNLLRKMKPAEQQFVLRQYKSQLAEWRAETAQLRQEHAAQQRAVMQQRTEVFRQNQENLRQARTLQAQHWQEEQKFSAPLSVGDRHAAAQDIASSLDEYKSALPPENKLSTDDERSIRTAATHIFMNRRSGVAPDEAVNAVVDLSDPTNKALDEAQPGPNGVKVKLRNGTSLQLDEQSVGAIQALRQRKIEALGKQQEEQKHAFGPRAARAVGTMVGSGAAAVGNLPQYGPLGSTGRAVMSKLWQAYQQATGNE